MQNKALQISTQNQNWGSPQKYPPSRVCYRVLRQRTPAISPLQSAPCLLRSFLQFTHRHVFGNLWGQLMSITVLTKLCHLWGSIEGTPTLWPDNYKKFRKTRCPAAWIQTFNKHSTHLPLLHSLYFLIVPSVPKENLPSPAMNQLLLSTFKHFSSLCEIGGSNYLHH